jgi:hypothetical protein
MKTDSRPREQWFIPEILYSFITLHPKLKLGLGFKKKGKKEGRIKDDFCFAKDGSFPLLPTSTLTSAGPNTNSNRE